MHSAKNANTQVSIVLNAMVLIDKTHQNVTAQQDSSILADQTITSSQETLETLDTAQFKLPVKNAHKKIA